MLKTLTNVTRQSLREVESTLWIPWAVAQKINATQKLNAFIEQGFRKYRHDLGTSIVFHGHLLAAYLPWIHNDIIQVWNSRDSRKVLAGDPKFINPHGKWIDSHIRHEDSCQSIYSYDILSNLTGIAVALPQPFALVIASIGLAVVSIKFFYQRY